MINDNKMTASELRGTWGLGTVFSLRMLGMFMVLPVMTTYGMTLPDATSTLVGVAIGIYGLTQAFFQIPFGLISDRIGRKFMIVGGLILFSLGSLLAAFSQSIWGIIIGRALQGSGAIASAIMALLSDLTREQHRTKAMACIGVSFGISFAIAMILGPMITHAFGLHFLFGIIAFLSLLGIVITLTVVPSTDRHVLNRESGMVKSSITKVLNNRRLLKLNFGIMCLHMLLMLTFVALPSALERAGLPAVNHWILYLVTMLISFAAVLPIILYAEMKRRIRSVLILCVTVLLIAEVILWSSNKHLWSIISGVQCFFVVFNVMEALLPSLISKEAPAGYKGTAMGVYATSQFIGVAIGGCLGGWLFDMKGTSAVFAACALVAFIWLIVSTTMREPPYVSSLRILISRRVLEDSDLLNRIKAQAGVTEVLLVKEEQSAYIKVDTKKTNRRQLEELIHLGKS